MNYFCNKFLIYFGNFSFSIYVRRNYCSSTFKEKSWLPPVTVCQNDFPPCIRSSFTFGLILLVFLTTRRSYYLLSDYQIFFAKLNKLYVRVFTYSGCSVKIVQILFILHFLHTKQTEESITISSLTQNRRSFMCYAQILCLIGSWRVYLIASHLSLFQFGLFCLGCTRTS